MASQSLRNEFHSDMATTILNDVQFLRSNYYYFLGKVESWGVGDSSPTEMQVDSSYENFLIRSNILYFKKITQNDVSLVCKRYNWSSGLLFKKWDHTKDMSDEMFYCMNSEFNVYKCLDNNVGSPSTVEPMGKSYTHMTTADGYTWKYMFSIPTFKRTKFNSYQYIPVQRALSDSFYNKGSIDEVIILDKGSGYTDQQKTLINIQNTAVGSGGSITFTVNSLTGAINSTAVVSGGSGYTKGAKISITTATGSGAVLTPVISGGVIQSVTITQGGIGYAGTDTATVYVGQASIIPVVSRTTGQIVDLKIMNPGAGYDTTPTLTVSVVAGATAGTGLYSGNSTALVQAVINNGEVVRALIIDPGQNYPTDAVTDLIIVGDGSGAVLSPVVYNGEIIDAIIESPGTGYTSAFITVAGAGTGAQIKAVTSTSDYQSDQSIVEQTTINGGLYSVEITNGGTNYTSTTTATIVGDGTGAEVALTIVAGVITKVTMTNVGSGYTYANIVFNDPERLSAPVGSVDAQAYVILPPKNGHGYNAVDELFASTIAFNTILKNENELLEIDIEQEFRQYGIIKNPVYAASGKSFRLDHDMVSYKLLLPSTIGLVEDEILQQGDVKFRVVSYNEVDSTVLVQKLGNVPVTITSLATPDNSRTYTVLDMQSFPLVDKYSGRMLYVSNENPFSIADGQNISVKTFIKF